MLFKKNPSFFALLSLEASKTYFKEINLISHINYLYFQKSFILCISLVILEFQQEHRFSFFLTCPVETFNFKKKALFLLFHIESLCIYIVV